MVARIWKATFLLVISLSGASSSDSTVDDSDSRITYSPSTQWSQGASCNGCLIRPDTSLTEQGTWHDTTYTPQQTLPSISFSFTGVAVSVFNILPGPVSGAITTHVDLTFELDGVLSQPFTYDPSADSPFRYRQNVFSASSLDNHEHQLIIRPRVDMASVILFDYIVFTVPDPPSSTSELPAPPIVSTTTTTTTTSAATSVQSSSLPTTMSTSPTVTSSSPDISLSSTSHEVSTSDSAPGFRPTSATSTLLSIPVPAFSSVSGTMSLALLPLASTSTQISASVSISTVTQSGLTSAPDPSSTGEHHISISVIIGASVGGGLLLLGILATLGCACHKRFSRHISRINDIESTQGDTSTANLHRHLMEYPPRSSPPRLSEMTQLSEAPPGSERHRGYPSVIVIDGFQPTSHISLPSSTDSAVAMTTGVVPSYSLHHSAVSLARDGEGDTQRLLDIAEDDTPPAPTASLSQKHDYGNVSPAPPDSTVLARLAELQEEIARIRARQEAAAILAGEAPPRYDEAQ